MIRRHGKRPPEVIAAIDGTPLAGPLGGIRRYTMELARALTAEFPQDSYWLVSDQAFETELPSISGQGGRWWSLGVHRALRSVRADVFHGTDFAVPYIPLRPSVMTVHDLSPWLQPDWHGDKALRVRKRTPLLVGLGIATLIVTPTETVRYAVSECFRIPPSRIVTVPEAAATDLRRVAVDAPPVPYFLWVGTLEPRKNLDTVVAAWRSLRTRHAVRLVLAGRVRHDFVTPPPHEGLELHGEVSEEELAQLYSGATAVVYPSLYEGFGLPVLEAMQCGAAVIASKDPALLEVSGGAALHVEARDAAQWADAMGALLANSELLEERRCLSRRRAGEFSWARTARLTREVYVEAIRRFHG